MYKYLLLISASAVPGAAYAQTASEQALEEIIAAQDEANEAGDQQATVGSYRSAAPAEAIITVTANGLGTDLRNTGQSVTVIERDEIEQLHEKHGVGFFILADEEPTINRKKFIEFCQELIDRGLPEKVKWGINTRVTDIYRDRELLAFYRKAGLVHVSLGTEAAAQMKLDRFHKETKVEENKQAIRLLREADIFVEAQFIVGLDNETPETLEETYKMAWDWQPDLANWAMYTPWPFTPLFEEIKDQVEIHDFSKYNFVTPIMKPAAMERGGLLNGVMKNYRRFYMQKALFHYPWRGTGFRRRYLLGCLYAFLRAGFKRRFYDLGKAGYWGPQTRTKVDWHFDESREAAANAATDWQSSADRAAQAAARREAVRKQMKERGDSRAAERHPDRIDVP